MNFTKAEGPFKIINLDHVSHIDYNGYRTITFLLKTGENIEWDYKKKRYAHLDMDSMRAHFENEWELNYVTVEEELTHLKEQNSKLYN